MTALIRSAAILATALIFQAAEVSAQSFSMVRDRSEFVDLVAGRTLRYPGVRLQVLPDGRISGSGLGIDVRGTWKWQGDFFCRELYWGDRDIGYNCQAVLRNGSTLRFVSDQGSGRHADLRLR
jgi:hypothetical protein